MKPFLSLLLSFILLVCLVGCGPQEQAPTTTTAPLPSTSSGPRHIHTYADADCTTPKTCTDCGYTRGEALGHDYVEGICTRCGDTDATFVPLLDGIWQLECLNEGGSQMEMISLVFRENGTADFGAGIYDRLSDVPEEEREEYMTDEDNWIDYSGEIYYYAGFGVYSPLVYTVDGNTITCTLSYNEDSILILERTAGNQLTVTYFEGQFAIIYLQVGDVLSCRP